VLVPRIVAVTGYTLFIAVAFGWRSIRSRRASGDWGWRSPVSSADRLGEWLCAAGCLLSFVAPLVPLVPVVDGLAMTEGREARVAASMSATLAGTLVAGWAQRHLADQWRAGVEASAVIVTSGPFRYVRNPFYLGCFLASGGVLVAVPSAAALAGLCLHVVAAEVIVRRVEEPVLAAAHPRVFGEYVAATGRFLPRPGRGR